MKIVAFWVNLTFVAVISSYAFASPHWSHEEQEEWGAIEDIGKPLPLNYPFADCAIGIHQSPVDLAGVEFDRKINKLMPRYPADMPAFYNSGHAIQINTSLDYAGYLAIGKERFPLIQFHFHAPSEHVIDGKAFEAELHFVHVRDDGRMAVLGILIEVGEENEMLQTILDHMPQEAGVENTASQIKVNPAKLLPRHRQHFYTYAGSLTTPPCREGINWYVSTEPITVSEAQLLQLKSFHTNNIRYPQPLNGRVIMTNDR
ncbi:carbonic anhydrase [Nitrosomonas aestuarii]|uniref:carbonic anhydrase n=1 Tax=Nitrosomonas aestuarii TaxID=52441 RepID=UPI000D31DDA2|nr:carbonic anhydrase family protein [Nitrosomonas aestuarii]PTN11268.1 carbonic anhydrase [Nitrosomonas aestuarii]